MMVELARRVRFLGLASGRAAIARPDYYSAQLSPFDVCAKVRRLSATTETEYLSNAASFVRAWTHDEVAYLTDVVGSTEQRMIELGIDPALPDDIFMVKTTGWEEGGANGYTRANMVILNQRSLSPNLFHHELFHIISRHDEAKRDAAYETLGFAHRAPFVFDDPLRISNPDAPALEHAVRVIYRNRAVDVAIVLRAARPYVGGSFFGYVTKKLLVIDTGDLLDFEHVEGLFRQIGRNTGYNIHQEEVCAVHFGLLLARDHVRSLPNPELIDRLHDALVSCR